MSEESFNNGSKNVRIVKCELCGKEFMAHPKARAQKYCVDCAPKMRKELNKKYREKKRAYRAELISDSPEKIEMCLHCEMESCSGSCAKLRDIT